MPVFSVLGTGQCLSPAALLPPIRLPPENCPAMMSGTFRAPTIPMIISSVRRKSPIKLPLPELDLQRTNATRLDCLHDTNRAAPAASPTYTSRNTPPLASATRKSQHHYYSTTTHDNAATTKNDHENHGRLKWCFPRMVASAGARCSGALEAVLISPPEVDAAGNGLDDSLRRPDWLGLRI
jgi:hypothetical protein